MTPISGLVGGTIRVPWDIIKGCSGQKEGGAVVRRTVPGYENYDTPSPPKASIHYSIQYSNHYSIQYSNHYSIQYSNHYSIQYSTIFKPLFHPIFHPIFNPIFNPILSKQKRAGIFILVL